MKRHTMPHVREGNVNVTPLIDVVMCLIIFFMLVAKIGVTTGAEPMDLPQTILGSRITDMGNTLTLNVYTGPAGHPLIKTLVEDRSVELKIEQTVNGQLQRPLLEVLRALRGNNPELKVIIRADKALNYSVLEPVLLACAQADVKNVNFNTAKVTEERIGP